MASISELAKAIHCEALLSFTPEDAFGKRDEIKQIIAAHVLNGTSQYWIDCMHGYGLWAMEVFDWKKLVKHEAYKCLEMEQTLKTVHGKNIVTTRCPIRINGEKLYSATPAPQLGASNKIIMKELLNLAS
jgi:crotonobetainyl-CoA:carnitine CoA-transferase CaiB-like acyl-CoA transferase